MSKLRRTLRDTDPETGQVSYSKINKNSKPNEKGRGGYAQQQQKKSKPQRAARRRRRKEHYADCPPRPLFHTPTLRLEPSDPEYQRLRAEVLSVGRCEQCGSTQNLTMDHIIPVSKGGGWHRANLQCLCRSCNLAKADSLPVDIAA